jgi:hypothetical protein
MWPGRAGHLLSFAARLTHSATPAGATEATLVASA